MQSVDVLIIIEHRAREFESACLLKVAFEKQGMSVAVDSVFPNKEALPFKYSAKVVIVPWDYNDRDMRYWESFFHKSPNAVIINLHHEQYSGQDEDVACLPVGRARNVCHVSWGSKFTEALLRCGCDRDAIITAGNIRLDFFRPRFAYLSLSKHDLADKFHIDRNKRWVLFIANGYHLMDDAALARVSKMDANAQKKKEISDSCRSSFLAMATRYLETHSDTVFIYRPHPVFADKDKSSADLEHLCMAHPDAFKVVPDLPIRDWLLASDACISFHSTSVVECCSAHVPYYLFRTKKLPEELDYAFLAGYEYTITNYDEFIEALSPESNYNDESIKRRLADYYAASDCLAFEQIVSFALSQMKKSKRNAYRKSDCLSVYLKSKMKGLIGIFSCCLPIRKAMVESADGRWYRLLGIGEDAFTQQDVANECILIEHAFEGRVH